MTQTPIKTPVELSPASIASSPASIASSPGSAKTPADDINHNRQQIQKPIQKPTRPYFSSGPCAKRPGFALESLRTDSLGRSHRAAIGKDRLKAAIDKTRAILDIPDDYLIGIVPGSDTGAVEMALWSLLGARPVTVLAWESFGTGWVTDIVQQLKLDARIIDAPYGVLSDLTQVNSDTDIVFTWNGTTSGVRVPNADWISATRGGLTICDATSAVFAQELDWQKLDVTTFSWQKALGGEGGHGMIILSPRAVERLETYTPPWPIPKIFRLTKEQGTQGRKLIDGIFRGETINTPSMLCVEDYLGALDWAETIGGGKGLIVRADRNLALMKEWVARTDWAAFLAVDEKTLSNTSICLKITAPEIASQDDKIQRDFIKKMTTLLESEEAAYDIAGYRDAPAGLRIWGGASVEASDIKALLPWLEWAFLEVCPEIK